MKLLVKSIIYIILISVISTSVNGIAFADSNDAKIKKVEQKRQQIRIKINSLKKLERQEVNRLSRNQQKLEKNQQTLKQSKTRYTNKQQNINALQKELDSYIKKYNKRQGSSADRIRCIYKTKHTLILDLLMSTNSLSQFLDRIYYQNLIIAYDRQKMRELRVQSNEIAAVKKKLELEKRQLSRIIKDIDRENANIKETISQNKSMIEKIQKDKRAYERSERELKKQSDSLAAMIARTTRNSGVVVKGGFIKPVSGPVTSPFGWRVHPIFKSRIFHTGVDIGVPYGTPIKAANSGKVIFTGWYGGYGKVVIIDHGSCTGAPTTTLYAHMSQIKAVKGDNVTRGQVVGLVGTTGYSTGPHLHFEVRINGKPQNPINYI